MVSPQVTSDPMSATLATLTHFGRYLSWTAADQVISLGIPRLILFPILASMLGEDVFGSFVIALGAIQLVGLAPSNGLVGYIIRDLVREEPPAQAVLIRTTLVLTAAVVLPFTLFFIFGAPLVARLYDDNRSLLSWLPLLGFYLLITNIVETLLSLHRVRRTLGRMTLVHAVQTVCLFLAVPLYVLQGDAGVATAHVLAAVAALFAVIILEHRTIIGRPVYSSVFARAALKVWPAFSLSAIIPLSAGYLDRLLLGYWWSPADVAPFFAAVSTASMVAIPATVVSNVTLSMLGRVRDARGFNRRFYTLYSFGVLIAAVLVFFIGVLIGEPLLRFFYAKFADEALPLWNYAVAGFALLDITILLRPFVSKFLSPAMLPILSTLTLVARVAPLLVLVPKGGPLGAAQALLIGSVATAVLWFVLYLRSFIMSGAVTDARPVEELTPEL